ncbi:MAG: tRNA dihydrouridine(20/20a) synthase DusA [Rhodobacterales bacterium]|nr:MAG: tRNA dihydrouridine(20/20a) synthase DusA [Rhodobacterales bacterium]
MSEIRQSVGYAVLRAARLSVAPMMDWTDRHCRYLHRLMSSEVLLYTEMVAAPALVRGRAVHLLDFDPAEHPVAVQLGGSDPAELAAATRICCDHGYDEVNLNVGCPSDRVQSGHFGAVLMLQPDLVAECVAEMIAAADVEVTVKCRIGVDDQDPAQMLPGFIEKMRAAGVRRLSIHARKAWLQGLSPKENRSIPPLDYDLVLAMKQQFPDLHISLNGGVESLTQAADLLDSGLDGVMIGRAAYHSPEAILLRADADIFGVDHVKTTEQVVDEMRPYIQRHLEQGGRLHAVTRHMMGLFSGRPGARGWRRCLSEGASKPGAGLEVLDAALAFVQTR